MNWTYNKTRTRIVLDEKPKRLKKITGTRLASILGLNDWNTPFEAWCDITGVAKKPFVDSMYTIAGKVIEPKQLEFTKRELSHNIVGGEEYFGNIFEKVKYDYFAETKLFGGMWDAIQLNHKREASCVIEYKTTKRSEDWKNGTPTYYLIQSMLYAKLLGINKICMVVTFLEDKDYAHPELFEVTAENTKTQMYNLDEILINGKNIDELIEEARGWYDIHINSGMSPNFDEVKDKDILKILRSSKPSEDNNLEEMISLANNKMNDYDLLFESTGLNILEKEIKALKENIKTELIGKLSDTDMIVQYSNWKLSKTVKLKIDENKLRAEGIYDRYTMPVETLTLRNVNLAEE